MDSKLASCAGFSIRLARRNGHSHVIPHLRHALSVLVQTSQHGDTKVTRQKISLCQTLGLDDTCSRVDSGATASPLKGGPILTDAGVQTASTAAVAMEAECHAMLEKLMDNVRDEMSGLVTRLARVEREVSTHDSEAVTFATTHG